MNCRVRSPFMAAHVCMSGTAGGALFLGDYLPFAIWITVTAVLVAIAQEVRP